MAPPGVTPNPQMQPTNAGWPELRLVSSLLEAIRNVGFHRSFAADLLFVTRQGMGISRSRQIFRARNSLISRWRGTLEDLRVRGLM